MLGDSEDSRMRAVEGLGYRQRLGVSEPKTSSFPEGPKGSDFEAIGPEYGLGFRAIITIKGF